MNCDGVRGLLSAYVDGELSAGELLRVEQHLRRCHFCADDVDSLRQTIALVASLDEVEVPASFHTQLHERLVALGPPVAGARRTAAAPSSLRSIRKWAMPAAAVAAVAVLAVTTLQPGNSLGPVGIGVDSFFPNGFTQRSNQLAVGENNSGSGAQQNSDQPGENATPTDPVDQHATPDGGTDLETPIDPPIAPAPQVPNTGPVVVTTNQPGTERHAGPQVSYLTQLAASITSESARSALMAVGTATQLHDGSIQITVDASRRDATWEQIRGITGLRIQGDPVRSEYDYARDLAEAAAILADREQRVTQLQRQLQTLEDQSLRAPAQRELEQAVEQRSAAEDGLKNLEAKAAKAVFVIQLQVAAE